MFSSVFSSVFDEADVVSCQPEIGRAQSYPKKLVVRSTCKLIHQSPLARSQKKTDHGLGRLFRRHVSGSDKWQRGGSFSGRVDQKDEQSCKMNDVGAEMLTTVAYIALSWLWAVVGQRLAELRGLRIG